MISLIIGMYNGERFIEECLDSVFAQTISKEKLQIILVDDGSTDTTVEIAKKYKNNYPDNIVLVENKVNSRVSLKKTRNIGLHYADGEYIMFLDQDDRYREDSFDILHNLMDENSELDYLEYGFNYTDFDWNVTHTTNLNQKGFFQYDIENESERTRLACEGVLPGATFAWSKIYRKDFLLSNNIVHNDGEISTGYADNFFSCLVVNYAKHMGRLFEPLYQYRSYFGSYSHSSKINDTTQFERCKVGLVMIEECKRRGLYSKNREMVEYIFLRSYFLKTFWRFVNDFEPLPFEQLAKMRENIHELCPDVMNNKIIACKKEFDILLCMLQYEWTNDFLNGLKMGILSKNR